MMEKIDAMDEIIPFFASPIYYHEIEKLLTANSNLPGPRGNLTLAYSFADWFDKAWIHSDILNLLFSWTKISAEEAPTNHPREYLPFCGILAICTYYRHADEITKSDIMAQLKIAMSDKRWRTREAVAMGLQRIAEKDFAPILDSLSLWLASANALEQRAFVATLAHPPILHNKRIARYSLAISDEILSRILLLSKESRRSEEFTVLSKGLQYALSVFVAAQPEEGFDLLKKYARFGDPDLNKIIRSNLSKSRLTKKHTDRVNTVYTIMNLNKEENEHAE